MFLADLEADVGERVNLRDRYPDVVAELPCAAEDWRQKIEDRWVRDRNAPVEQ